MDAKELLREGRVDEALEEVKNDVRANPAESRHRTFLFQLLAVNGDWGRALSQLNVAGEMDPAALAMMHTYRDALSCEALRSEVMAGTRTPLLFGEPEEWLASMVQANKLSAEGRYAAAQTMREQAYESAPATSGQINGEPFEWIADADSRFGPLLEMIVNGKYYWVPFHRLTAINFEEPGDLRDVVWTAAYLTLANGGEAVGLVPTRYAGSESDEDSAIRLARKTDWVEHESGEYHGRGQRILATDAGEYSLLEVREIRLDTAADDDADSAAEE